MRHRYVHRHGTNRVKRLRLGALLCVVAAAVGFTIYGTTGGGARHPVTVGAPVVTTVATTTTVAHITTTTAAVTTTTLPAGLHTSPTVAPTPPTTLLDHGFVIDHPARPLPTGTILYTIQPGDTLSGIAAKFDQEGWGKLFVDNWVASVGTGGIADPNLILAGRVLVITNVSGRITMTMAAPK